MSKTRHVSEPLVRGYAVTHPGGRSVLPEQAGWDRLVYTASGTIVVRTEQHLWTVPPHRALWLPDAVLATMSNRYRTAVRSLYFATALHMGPDTAKVVAIHGFARELLLHVVRVCPLGDVDEVERALLTVLRAQLRELPRAELELPIPRDVATRRAAEIFRSDPHISPSLVARESGMSQRSLERRMVAETGLSLGMWRRRTRLLGSLESLAAGSSIAQASADAGYSTPSAFVAAFTRELDRSPSHFIRAT